eukprot:7964972-Pyramimonas_sp.AAC.1
MSWCSGGSLASTWLMWATACSRVVTHRPQCPSILLRSSGLQKASGPPCSCWSAVRGRGTVMVATRAACCCQAVLGMWKLTVGPVGVSSCSWRSSKASR